MTFTPRQDTASGGDNASRVAEAARILFDMGLKDHVGSMNDWENTFTQSLLDKFEQYGDRMLISSKQIFALRNLLEKYL